MIQTSMFEDVEDFNNKFGLPTARPGVICQFPAPEVLVYRDRFLAEELNEYRLAVNAGDLSGALDALVDLAYVVLGTAHFYGAPFDKLWDEVQRANMAKERGINDARHKRGAAEGVRKPAGWTPPDITGIIAQYNTKTLALRQPEQLKI